MAFYAALGVGFLVQRCCKIQHIASGLQRNSTWHWLFGSFGHLFPQYSKDFHPPWLPENSNVVLTRQPSKSSPGRFKMLLQIWAKHRLTRVLLERCTWGTLQRAERDPHWADFLKPRNGGPDASLIQRSCFLSFSDFFESEIIWYTSPWNNSPQKTIDVDAKKTIQRRVVVMMNPQGWEHPPNHAWSMAIPMTDYDNPQ